MSKKSKKKSKQARKLSKEEPKVMICRVCLTNSDTSDNKCYSSLYDSYKDHNILHYLVSIANVKINANDGLPTYICVECFATLELAVDFKQRCEYSDTYLHKTLEEITLNESKTVPPLVIKKEIEDETNEFIDMEYLEADYVDELPIEMENVKQSYNEDQSLLRPNYYKRERNIIKEEENKFIKEEYTFNKVECNDCGEQFKSKCKLRVHLRKVHKPIYNCEFCKREFKSYLPYKRHRDNKTLNCIALSKAKIRVEGSGKNKTYFCVDCDYQGKRLSCMKVHSVVHTGEKPFVCEICSSSYTQIGALLSHKENAHQQIRVEITCNFCGKHVKGRQKSYRHLKLHSLYRYQCDVCNAFLKTRNSMLNHLQRHTNYKSFTCEICAKSFYTSNELCNHKRFQHLKISRKKFSCDMCSYKTINIQSIRKHRAKHADCSMFPCNVCGKFFDCRERRDSHLLRHNDENKFKCTECDKQFMRRDTLQKHIRAVHRTSLLLIPDSQTLNVSYDPLVKENKPDFKVKTFLNSNPTPYESFLKEGAIDNHNMYNTMIKEKHESVQVLYNSMPMVKQETEVEVIIESDNHMNK